MKVTDYIVEFLQRKGIHDFFGYQGTMIAHLVDSIEKNPHTRSHSSYHEQGAAFAACGYAQAGERCACAYATSGPGAANLISGIADAYFDSLPVVFLTGQLNTYEYSGIPGLRQQGFQEIDIVAMAKPVTKYAVQIREDEDIVKELNKVVDTDVIYTDEDKVSTAMDEYFSPNFKPDFNLDMLRSNNYFCHFFVAKKELIEAVGGFRGEYNGAQDYDLFLRCIEKAERIGHIPKILYHWRVHQE